MDKPLCPICKHNHSGVDHIWDKEPDKPKAKFDRLKYQREFMRKSRAKKK